MPQGTCDVVVVGGGAFGAATAFALAKAGAGVTLLDVSLPGRATSASAGGLWPLGESLGLGCGVILHAAHGQVPEPLPRAFMEFLRASNARFAALGHEIRALAGIDIEAESGTGLLYLIYDDAQERHARQILAWLGAASEGAVAWTAADVASWDPLVSTDVQGAVYFPGDNQVNPLLLSEGLKRAACALGARFVPQARVRALRVAGGRVTAVESSQGTFACDVVVNAAGAWAAEIAGLAGAALPVVPVRGQILLTETLARGTLRSNLSTRDCYLLQKAHGEVLVGSTTEHAGFDVGVRPASLAALAAGAVRAVPCLAAVTVKRTWSGLRPGTPDELPILGPAPEVANLHHAAGGFRTGIVAAPLAGEMVAAAILGHTPPYPLAPFRADRFTAS